jgi:hypothetical protein
MARDVLVTHSMSSTKSPRFLELVVGRLLELVVHSVEGVRERVGSSRLADH